MAEKQHSNEWYTPAKYIEAAREVMGGIDLDPASSAIANETVKATRYYSIEDNGLNKEWYGKTWLNPPFNGGLKAWMPYLVQQYDAGNIEQAITVFPLLPHVADTHWFQRLLEYPVCYPKPRIRFYTPGMAGGIPIRGPFNSCVAYLGPHEQKFIDVFSQFGRIARAIDTPRRVEKPIPLWDVERIYA